MRKLNYFFELQSFFFDKSTIKDTNLSSRVNFYPMTIEVNTQNVKKFNRAFSRGKLFTKPYTNYLCMFDFVIIFYDNITYFHV